MLHALLVFSGTFVKQASRVWGSKWGPPPGVVPSRSFTDKDGSHPQHRVGGHTLVEPSHIAPVACASGEWHNTDIAVL
jgi:hypothetical protein